MTRRLAPRLGCERGDALIEGLLALGLVLLVICFTGQAIAYVHARNIAEAAAQSIPRASTPTKPAAPRSATATKSNAPSDKAHETPAPKTATGRAA